MKISVASLLVIITLMLISNSCRSVLQVEKYPKTDCYSEKEYVVKPVTFSIILTGTASTQEAFLFKGGSLFKSRELSHIAVLVKHNNKSFLFDTGLGGNIDTQFKEMSFLHRQMFRYSKQQSVKQQLIANSFKSDSIKTIILSHLHWDHSSGIKIFQMRPFIQPKTNMFMLNQKKHILQLF
ncbi:MBL fold metallo-hydrolase [Flavobacterium adhaerens]|uniref:MBL fold metallo-hydrolase n=1 Tax=Flavobacterium adhaerens TaxID=3149043 RepID=UPI0032B5BA52